VSDCWLATHGVMENGEMGPCDGAPRRVHLIPKRLIKRKDPAKMWDRRAWVWACGGPRGNAGHHGMLDHSRTLRIPRAALPPQVEELADELGLSWWLYREYGAP
jgi:hypothetical protein